MSMRSWIEQRDSGSVLVRSGEGRVTAVASISAADAGVDPSTNSDYVVIELQCLSYRRPRSIRVTLRAIAPDMIELVERARALEGSDEMATWLVEWHRRPGIPAELPIEHLHLPTDTTPFLVALSSNSAAVVDAPADALRIP